MRDRPTITVRWYTWTGTCTLHDSGGRAVTPGNLALLTEESADELGNQVEPAQVDESLLRPRLERIAHCTIEAHPPPPPKPKPKPKAKKSTAKKRPYAKAATMPATKAATPKAKGGQRRKVK